MIIKNFRQILHGGDYNPDQWLSSPGTVDRDFELMDEAHCNTFSVAIFSWSQLEEEPDRFEFGWLDDVFERCAKSGKKIFLATPSASKPAWLAQRWPDSCRADRAGNRQWWGARQNSCFSSPGYRERVRIINRKLAERYARHPALGGWHVANEYHGECGCERCRKQFHDFLRKRYGSLEKLNQAYWSAFWGHRLTDWSQVEPFDYSMDGAALDWWRFCTEQIVDFFRMEIEAIREFSDAPVTTNLMGLFPTLDYWKFAPLCDFISDDCYPTWYDGETEREAALMSLRHDMNYSMLNKPFLMMESCPGIPNTMPYMKLRRPGEFEREMLLALGHGADGTMYFQWRKGRNNCEKFHGAVVGHDGSDQTMAFRRVAAYGRKLENLSGLVDATREPVAAVVYDWESNWALGQSNFAGGNATKKWDETVLSSYRALWNCNIDLAVIDSEQNFDGFRLLVLPMLFLFKPGVTEKLRSFVERGGTLVATYFSGYVDENNCCFSGGNPGGAAGRELFGVWSEDFDGLQPTTRQNIVWNGTSYPVADYAEVLHLEGAACEAVYGCDFYAGTPAVTRHALGNGSAIYVGARTGMEFLNDFYAALLKELGIEPVLPALPPAVRATRRRAVDGGSYYFLYNLTGEEHAVRLPAEMTDLWQTGEATDKVTLPPNGATVLYASGGEARKK